VLVDSGDTHWLETRIERFRTLLLFAQTLRDGAPFSFCDAGCGDGKLLLEASKRHDCLWVAGIERDNKLYERLLKNMSTLARTTHITLHHGDVLDHDYSRYDIVFAFGPSVEVAAKLDKLVLRQLKPNGVYIQRWAGAYGSTFIFHNGIDRGGVDK